MKRKCLKGAAVALALAAIVSCSALTGCDDLKDMFDKKPSISQQDKKPGQSKPGINIPGQNKPGQNKPGQNKPGQ